MRIKYQVVCEYLRYRRSEDQDFSILFLLLRPVMPTTYSLLRESACSNSSCGILSLNTTCSDACLVSHIAEDETAQISSLLLPSRSARLLLRCFLSVSSPHMWVLLYNFIATVSSSVRISTDIDPCRHHGSARRWPYPSAEHCCSPARHRRSQRSFLACIRSAYLN